MTVKKKEAIAVSPVTVNTVNTVDPVEIVNKLTTISTQVSSLPVITSDDDYDVAYEIRAKIKSAIKWIHSRTKPNIKRWNEGHKASLAEERDLVKPFSDLDSQLDEIMLEWNRKKKEIEEAERSSRANEVQEVLEALLLEEDVTSDSDIKGFEITSLLPVYVPDKPRGERIYKRIKIIDPNLFNPEFIQWFLSDEDVKDTVRKWLEKQAKLLGGFEGLLDLAGKGSIEQVEEESISIR